MYKRPQIFFFFQNCAGLGGNGYSGGGGGGQYNGGSNGGDGEGGQDGQGGPGGHGSGKDITSFQLEHFVLSPGAGWKYTSSGGGGGGGGVLVNGEGPERRDPQGEGYGGGGLSGIVLLEIAP